MTNRSTAHELASPAPDAEPDRRVAVEGARAGGAEASHALAVPRDRLLDAVVTMARGLLEVPLWKETLPAALGRIGAVAGLQHVLMFRERLLAEGRTHRVELEWREPATRSHASVGLPEFANTATPSVVAALHAGRSVWAREAALDALTRVTLEPLSSRSIGWVPLRVHGTYWGTIAFVDCTSPRIWSVGEIDALSAAAGVISSAIAREQIEVARHALERQQLREALEVNRLLEGVVAASRALLEEQDFEIGMKRWLATVGNAIRADRAMLGGFAPDASAKATAVVTTEWARPGLASITGMKVPSTLDFQAWTARLKRGESIWAHCDELEDPASVRYWEQTNCLTNLIVPVVVERETVGWLACDFEERREWSLAIDSVIRAAAHGAAAAIRRQTALEQLLAERDTRIRAEQARALEAGRQTTRIESYAQLLLAVAKSAEELVAVQAIETCMDEVLRRLGLATRADRACLSRICWTPESGEFLGSQEITHEWAREGCARQMEGPARSFQMQRDDSTWSMMQLAFETQRFIVCKVEDLGEPFRTVQSALGMTWSLAYPIVLDGVVWGGLGFDYSTPYDDYDAADLSALQTVASAITEVLRRQSLERRALAIERQRGDENERLVTFLQVVVQSSRSLLDSEQFEPALRRWLGEVGRVALASRTTYYDFLLDERTGISTARVLGEWVAEGVESTVAASFEQPFVVHPRGGEDAMVRLSTPRIATFYRHEVPDAQAAFLGSRNALSFVSVPIFQDDAQRGCLSFDYDSQKELSPGEVAILQSAADTLTAIFKRNAATQEAIDERDRRIEAETRRASESARHASRTEHSSALLSAVATSAEELLATREPASRLNEVLARIGRVAGARRARIARLELTPEDTASHGWQDITHEWIAEGHESLGSNVQRRYAMSRSDPSWERALRRLASERRIAIAGAGSDEPFWPGPKPLGVAWSLCYPMFLEGRIWGLLGFDYVSPREHDDEGDLAALQTVASTIADALAREQLELRSLQFERNRADESERLVAMLELIVTSSRALIDADDFEPALRVWLGEFGRTTRASRVGFAEMVQHEPSAMPTARMLCEWVRDGVKGSIAVSFAEPYVIDPRGASETMDRLATGRVVVRHIESTESSMRDLLFQQGNATVITVPIFLSGRQWGCLAFDHPVHTELTASDAAILQTAADTLSAILKRNEAAASAILEREARIAVEQRRFSELAHANDALRISLDALADAEGEDGFFRQSLMQIRVQSGARSAYLFACDQPESRLRLIGSVTNGVFERDGAGDDPPMFENGFTMDPSLLEELKAHGRLLWLPVERDLPITPAMPESIQSHLRLGHKANALHALSVGTRQVGLIGLVFDTVEPPSETKQELVHTLCQPLTLALELARLATTARRSAEQAAVLAERDRMAAEIHDSLAQSFTSIAMQSESLSGRLSEDPQSARVLRLIERTAREGLSEARASVLALRPLDAAPGALDQALWQLVERSSVHGGIQCSFESRGVPCELAGAVRESLFRIAQEASSNAMRHSGGKQIRIRLSYGSRRVVLTIEDDGLGLVDHNLQKQTSGFGMSGMQTRAAAIGGGLTFAMASLGGLSVSVEAPCHGVEGPAP